MTRLAGFTATVALAGLTLAGCGGDSSANKAKQWVQDNRGRLSADEHGWLAFRASWGDQWPWRSHSAVVGCDPNIFGGSTFVQLSNGRLYWLYAKDAPYGGAPQFAGSAADVTTNDLAQIRWSTESRDLCGLTSH